MVDFDGIPALGDSYPDHDEDEEAIGSRGESDQGLDTRGKYRFNGKHIYVTWSKSTVDSKEEFYEKLLTMMPAGVRMFGGRELHQDGTPHYHVVFSFAEKVHWADAAKRFCIEGDTNAIRFEKPKPRQPISGFLGTTMAYCSKDGDTFGERLSTVVPRAPPTSRRKPPTPTTQVLPTPRTFTIKSEYVGTRYRDLVVQPGDNVVVYAWKNGQETAIAYNQRSDMAGQVPAGFLEPVEPQPEASSEICMFFSSRKTIGRVGDLTWKAGEYIRICKWDDRYKKTGHGFNLATMKIGRFLISPNDAKVVRA